MSEAFCEFCERKTSTKYASSLIGVTSHTTPLSNRRGVGGEAAVHSLLLCYPVSLTLLPCLPYSVTLSPLLCYPVFSYSVTLSPPTHGSPVSHIPRLTMKYPTRELRFLCPQTWREYMPLGSEAMFSWLLCMVSALTERTADPCKVSTT